MRSILCSAALVFVAAPAWAQRSSDAVQPEASQPQLSVFVLPEVAGEVPDEMPAVDAMQSSKARPAVAESQPETTCCNFEARPGWPNPTADDGKYSFVLLDLLEYQESSGPGSVRWDAVGWFGGDYERLWIKSEGAQSTRAGQGGETELQVLYGRLISPYFDMQVGGRVVSRSGQGAERTRAYAAIGVQGLAPYQFDIEPTIFISTKGQISGRVTASFDQLLTQRLVLQPRFETSFALEKDEAFGIGSGLGGAEVGIRLRYEIRREFAFYVGITHSRSFGSTRQLLRAEGERTRQTNLLAGLRVWF